MSDIQDKIYGMSAWAREVMWCLFLHGPTMDGDMPSKEGCSELVRLGYAERWNGWQWLTKAGVEFAVSSMEMGRKKESHQRTKQG